MLLLLVFLHLSDAAKWFVGVSGSSGWANARHQADLFHAYQIVHNHGIPDDHIILMYYNDVAWNQANPFPGQVFNSPTGPNVFKNIPLDYTGENVTAEKFLAVLTRDQKQAQGRVLQSTADDHVFVTFFDHGSVDFICFPSGPYLRSHELLQAFEKMKEKQMFNQLTFYLESCESGSMFLTLPEILSIYALTASDAYESSWATYCPPNDVVDGVPLNTCLGDEFSVNWLQDDDSQSSLDESLERQFRRVEKETKKSHVSQYGDLDFVSEPLSDFLGTQKTTQTIIPPIVPQRTSDCDSSVNSRDVPLHLMYYRYLRSKEKDRIQLGKELRDMLHRQILLADFFHEFTHDHNHGHDHDYDHSEKIINVHIVPFDYSTCYDMFLSAYQSIMGKFDDHTLQYASVLSKICQEFIGDPDLISLYHQFVGGLQQVSKEVNGQFRS